MHEVPLVWIALAIPAGLLIGAWTGLSGYSGWPLVVPVLLVIHRVSLFETVVASILVDWINALVAAAVYLRRRDADVRTARRWAAGSAPIILCGALAAFALLQRWSGLLEGGVGPIGLVLGLALIARAMRSEGDPSAAPGEVSSQLGRAAFRAGALTNAFLMGLVGMGGAFNMAMLLILLRGTGTRAGVGTGLLYTALALPISLLAYLVFLGFEFGLWSVVLPFCAGAAVASGLAAWQAGRLPERALGILVGICVLSAAIAATLQHWAIAR
jgi:uncharacterized membrane protein YfcA